MRRIISIFTLILSVFIFMECFFIPGAQKDENGENQKISLIMVTNRTDLVDNTLKDLAEEYMKENPHIDLSIEGIKQPNDLLKIKASAGEGADITIIPTDVNTKALSAFYEPLDDLGFTYKNLRGYSTGLGIDNKLYGVNCGIGYTGIVYNKKSFEKAGITKIPETMDEFYSACEKLKIAGITPFAINFNDEWPLNVYSTDFILPIEHTGNISYSSSLSDKDLFSDDGGLYYSLKFLESMKDRGYIEDNFRESNWSTCKRKHAKGEIAMTFLGSWYPSQLVELGAKKEDIGMFPFPDTKIIQQTNDWQFGISKGTKHIQEAKKLFRWMFYDGNYAKACNIVCSVNNNTDTNWFLSELFSYNKPILVSRDEKSEELNAILKNFSHTLSSVFKEYLESDNPKEVIDKYNKLWKEAREEFKSENTSSYN